jgi:hypothetical protein
MKTILILCIQLLVFEVFGQQKFNFEQSTNAMVLHGQVD